MASHPAQWKTRVVQTNATGASAVTAGIRYGCGRWGSVRRNTANDSGTTLSREATLPSATRCLKWTVRVYLGPKLDQAM